MNSLFSFGKEKKYRNGRLKKAFDACDKNHTGLNH